MDQTVVPTQAQILHQVGGKHQMVPVVYIQGPSKISTKTSNASGNVVMPQIQLQNLTATTVNAKNVTLGVPSVGGQSLLLGKQPIVLQKPTNIQTIPANNKNGIAYVTMLKSVSKSGDTNLITSNRLPITTINKLKSDGLHMLGGTGAITNSAQKFVIAPMPKVTSNRLPITATTNSVQSKISFMPITLPSSTNKRKMINFKIADGQIQQENITLMCNPPKTEVSPVDVDNKNLLCTEMMEMDAPEDKSYQISIVEDSNSRTDSGYTISINEDERAAPKYSKHGVSILKKTYTFLERKEKPVTTQANFKSITTISDTDTKEVRITSEQTEEPPMQKKAERRRKSAICLRTYHEDTPKEESIQPAKIPKLEEPVPVVDLVAEIKPEPIPEETVAADKKIKIELGLTTDDYDVAKLLDWEDGIGTLPGSDLKFQMNEFGFLEYMTKDEYRKICYRKQLKVKETEKKKIELPQEMRCLECGCFGMPSEFISPKYCSYDCQSAGEKYIALKLKKKKKKALKKESGEKQDSSDDDTSIETSSDKFNYPWTCQKKGFSWAKYLDHIKAKGAPVKLFRDPFPYNRNGFRPGMKLEGIDPAHPSYFCVLTVAEILGYRVRMHFDGYPDNYDFWVNADSMDIFPAGFCEKFGHTLHPPPGYEKDFNWNFYLKYTRSPAAPKQLFAHRPAIFPNGFRTRMKLEAVDRKNTSLVCVATITDMMDNRILVHFDSWDDMYDYWADPTSPYIHPVGWCDQNGHNLTPPNDHPSPETFTWERHLKETKCVAAPVRAFKQRPVCGFKKGMRLECVDRRVPQLIRVATVDEVREHQLRISFDGWPDRYCIWVDDDSTDIHPVGWCQKTGHPIEPPLTPDDVYDFLDCATVGCRGQGHIRGPIFSTHASQKNCPYADENIDIDKILPDRLLTPDRQIEAVVPVSREPRDKIKGKRRRPKFLKSDCSEDDLTDDADDKSKVKIELLSSDIKKELTTDEENIDEFKMRKKHQKYLSDFIKCDKDPREWSIDEVVEFVTTVPLCKRQASLFGKNRIDGVSFLMLTQEDLVEIMRFKLGPAITLYNCIIILRRAIISCT